MRFANCGKSISGFHDRDTALLGGTEGDRLAGCFGEQWRDDDSLQEVETASAVSIWHNAWKRLVVPKIFLHWNELFVKIKV